MMKSENMESTQDETVSLDIDILKKNHAEDLDETTLKSIGEKCRLGYEEDRMSRSEWEHDVEEWTLLAKQVREEKSFPWRNASNVKYPLLSTAAMQFAARAYPSLVPSNGKVVQAIVVGKDPTGEKAEKANRVATYCSWQILHEMVGWEEDMDRLLMMLPIVGCMFKKTWFDANEKTIKSKLILPKNFVVNYWTTSLEETERTSEIIEISPRKLKEYQNSGVYLNVDVQKSPVDSEKGPDDDTAPYVLIEQHTFLDLEEDGYAKPYIVTFEESSGQVLSIYRRHTLDDVIIEDGKLLAIKPTQMYTKFGFIPNPDGSFYDIGFGLLLGPINQAINTLTNQLIDSGTINNMQSGFIGKALKMKMGESAFGVGEWKSVNAVGDDLRKQIVPLPTKEPSGVLFNLMQALITSGKELASVAEIFTGKMPGQNTPATTTMASVEQGMKVFTAVYKRIFRSLSEEFKKIYKLNGQYLNPETYVAVLDAPVGPEDFKNDSYDICPGADPSATTNTEKLMKAQALVELMSMAPGILDPIQVISRVLDAQEQPNWQQLFTQQVQQTGQVPPPPPDPKLIAIQAKMEADQQKNAMDLQQRQVEMELDTRDRVLQMQMKQQEHAQKMQHEQQAAIVKAKSDIAMSNIFAATERTKAMQALQNSQAEHQQKMQQSKEATKLQNQKSKSGSSTQGQSSSKKT